MLDSTVGGAGLDSPKSPTAKSPKQVTPRSSKGLRKLRGQLPRAWPSMYAVSRIHRVKSVATRRCHARIHCLDYALDVCVFLIRCMR